MIKKKNKNKNYEWNEKIYFLLLTFQGFIKLIIIEFSVEKFTLELDCIYKLLFKLEYIIVFKFNIPKYKWLYK